MKPYMTVASSGDNGYTWTDEYPVQFDAAGIAAIATHNPQCDSQRSDFRRAIWQAYLGRNKQKGE